MCTDELLLLLGHFSRVQLCETPQTAAHQAPPSPGFSRQEHWSGLPLPSPMHESEKWKWSCSVMSDSQRPHGLQPTRLLRPWDFPGKSTGVGCHRLRTDELGLSYSHTIWILQNGEQIKLFEDKPIFFLMSWREEVELELRGIKEIVYSLSSWFLTSYFHSTWSFKILSNMLF